MSEDQADNFLVEGLSITALGIEGSDADTKSYWLWGILVNGRWILTMPVALALAGCTEEASTVPQGTDLVIGQCVEGQPATGDTAYAAGRYVEAFQAWQPCAERGDEGSQFALAIYYSEGKALPPNLIEAYKWAILATGGESFLAMLIEQQMSDSQLATARALINSWQVVPSDPSV